jgi:hypothetical protein
MNSFDEIQCDEFDSSEYEALQQYLNGEME